MQSLHGNICCPFRDYVPLRPDFRRYRIRMRLKLELSLTLSKEGIPLHSRFYVLLLWWGLLVLQNDSCLWWWLLFSPQQYHWILSSSMVDYIQDHSNRSRLYPFLLYRLLFVLMLDFVLQRSWKLYLSISWYKRWELHKMAKGQYRINGLFEQANVPVKFKENEWKQLVKLHRFIPFDKKYEIWWKNNSFFYQTIHFALGWGLGLMHLNLREAISNIWNCLFEPYCLWITKIDLLSRSSNEQIHLDVSTTFVTSSIASQLLFLYFSINNSDLLFVLQYYLRNPVLA